MDALENNGTVVLPFARDAATRLRLQMESEALQALEDDDATQTGVEPEFAPDVIEEVAQFLRLQVRLDVPSNIYSLPNFEVHRHKIVLNWF